MFLFFFLSGIFLARKWIQQTEHYNYILFKKFLPHWVYTYRYYSIRVIWRGKAFRVRCFSKARKFTFNFGHGHWCKFLWDLQTYHIHKFRRQNYYVYWKIRKKRLIIVKFFNNIRLMNKYTKRGIRVRRTPYIRRFGKISQVNSILHGW